MKRPSILVAGASALGVAASAAAATDADVRRPTDELARVTQGRDAAPRSVAACAAAVATAARRPPPAPGEGGRP